MMRAEQISNKIWENGRAIQDVRERIRNSTDIQYIDDQEAKIFSWAFEIVILAKVYQPGHYTALERLVLNIRSIEFRGSYRMYGQLLKKAEI